MTVSCGLSAKTIKHIPNTENWYQGINNQQSVRQVYPEDSLAHIMSFSTETTQAGDEGNNSKEEENLVHSDHMS